MSKKKLFEKAIKDAPALAEAIALMPAGYRIDNDGVWIVSAKGETTTATPDERISGPIWVRAFARNHAGGAWGRVLKFMNADGGEVEIAVPFPRFHEGGSQLAQELADLGLLIAPGQERKLTAYLGKFNPKSRRISVDRLGWLDSTDGALSYVLPTRTVSAGAGEPVIFQPERNSPTVATMQARGTLDEWQQEVAVKCAGHPLLVFAMCSAMCGPLLKAAQMDGGCFHYYGRSSHGKTCCAQIAASVWGCGADPADAPDRAFVRRWNSTTNALEGLAAAHNDNILILDEIGTSTSRDFGAAVYNLLGGQGKNAMDVNRNLKKNRSWRILLLSTGEISGREKIEQESKIPVKAGQLVRLIDIPTGTAIVDNIEGRKVFVETLKHRCSKFYGTAGPAFIEALTNHYPNTSALAEALDSLLSEFDDVMAKGIAAEIARAGGRFALVGAAGIMAVRLGILPLLEEDIKSAIKKVHSLWLKEAEELPDVVRALESIREFILRHQHARFKNFVDPANVTIKDLAGYIDDQRQLFYFTKQGFKEACGGHDHKQVASELQKRGLLVANEGDRQTCKRTLPGSSKAARLYAVKDEILSFAAERPSLPTVPNGGGTPEETNL